MTRQQAATGAHLPFLALLWGLLSLVTESSLYILYTTGSHELEMEP